ncbi:hypothetical protein [Campylobacter armoricus]|uniref:hypothetical protein n=1 Tax=Campylobacter armoricus TaxID=2505970 RepID=UPI0011172100|nr:hypothetical protein [Campylobacter armoricus]
MKQAFSLLEFVLSLIILGILFVILSVPSTQIYKYTFNIKKLNNTFFDLNYALLSMEKIFESCIDLKYSNNSFECYMNADDDIFFDISLKKFNFSGVILEDNGKFFSPKSNFYFIENGISQGIFSNYKDMYSEKKQKIYPSDYFYIYNPKESKVYKIIANDKEVFYFSDGENFTGFYRALYAYVKIYFKNENIYIQISDLNHYKKDFLLMKDISKIEINKENNIYSIKLCEKSNNECLIKWMFK